MASAVQVLNAVKEECCGNVRRRWCSNDRIVPTPVEFCSRRTDPLKPEDMLRPLERFNRPGMVQSARICSPVYGRDRVCRRDKLVEDELTNP